MAETTHVKIKIADHLGFQVLGGLMRVAKYPLHFLEQLLSEAAGENRTNNLHLAI